MTAQTPDRIVIDDEEHVLLATPLDRLLGQLTHRPELVAESTANWRGYVARWRVAHGQLVLDDVRGWYGEDRIEVGPAAVIPGVDLQRTASWVTDTLRVGVGKQVRHVHADFESRYERELLLDVHRGAVTAVRELAQTGAMGNAGPYLLDEPLLGDLSGGGFGQLIAARDLDGRPLVAKAPRPVGGSMSGTEVRAGDVPIHMPAKAYVQRDGAWVNAHVGADLTAAALYAEAEILRRDQGILLPGWLGIWDHEASGSIVLVMERLEGRSPTTPEDVRNLLAAVADAVDRHTFDAHGDLKLEHVFINDRVHVCDPGPRFDDPSLHAFTPAYNPAGSAARPPTSPPARRCCATSPAAPARPRSGQPTSPTRTQRPSGRRATAPPWRASTRRWRRASPSPADHQGTPAGRSRCPTPSRFRSTRRRSTPSPADHRSTPGGPSRRPSPRRASR